LDVTSLLIQETSIARSKPNLVEPFSLTHGKVDAHKASCL